MSDIVIDTAEGDRDIAEFAAVDAEAFAGESAEENERWLRADDLAMVRVARIDGKIVGGYGLRPAGQFFGGRLVPAQCVITVAVDAVHRRRGVAGALMRDAVAVARERGGAVAPLTASTTSLYRRWGWEVCGRHISQMVRTGALTTLRGEHGELVAEPELDAILRLRSAHLAAWDGPLDMPPAWIDLLNVVEPHRQRTHPCVGWMENGSLTGYLRYEPTRPSGQRWMRVWVDELLASTPDALRGLLGFLGGFSMQAKEIHFSHSTLPLNSPVLWLLPDGDKQTEIEGRICWMQRIIDLPRAVSARGWRGEDAVLHLEVDDPATGEATRWVLEVTGGRGSAEAGGEGRVRIGIGALAAWFSGWLPAMEAGRMGLASGAVAELDVMDAALGVCRPWTPDFF